MTATAVASAALKRTKAADTAAASAAHDEQHLGHDFPYLTCCVCRFPIPPWDLAGDEYEHRHASTCTPTPQRAPRVATAGSAGSAGWAS